MLEMNRPEQALAEYEADLKFNPNRFNGLYGAARAAELAGKSDKSNQGAAGAEVARGRSLFFNSLKAKQ
jgi:hypothetical protein